MKDRITWPLPTEDQMKAWPNGKLLEQFVLAVNMETRRYLLIEKEVLRRMAPPERIPFIELDGRGRNIVWDPGDPRGGIAAGYVAEEEGSSRKGADVAGKGTQKQ